MYRDEKPGFLGIRGGGAADDLGALTLYFFANFSIKKPLRSRTILFVLGAGGVGEGVTA